MSTVFLNGAFIPKAEATISVDDRGFLLGDGLYEVTPFYEGVPFGVDRHLARLERGLSWIRISYDVSSLEEMHRALIAKNGPEGAERSLVYVQITQGLAPRPPSFPQSSIRAACWHFALFTSKCRTVRSPNARSFWIRCSFPASRRFSFLINMPAAFSSRLSSFSLIGTHFGRRVCRVSHRDTFRDAVARPSSQPQNSPTTHAATIEFIRPVCSLILTRVITP